MPQEYRKSTIVNIANQESDHAPGSPLTPGTSGTRVTCNPLWKKKSLLRMSSSSQAKKRQKRLSQARSPPSKPSHVTESKYTMSSISTTKYRMSPTPKKARLGPELPPNVPLVGHPYMPKNYQPAPQPGL